MRIVIAPDSFKECLSSARVSEAIAAGVRRVFPKAEISCVPMADGGEGTVEALVKATSGQLVSVPSVDALLRPVQSFYGVLGDGKTAVMEMAAAAGIERLAPNERNPMVTSTYGTGLLVKAALEAGYHDIIAGLGGSATNDGGAGMAEALGYRFFDRDGNPVISHGGRSLINIGKIDSSGKHPSLQSARLKIAADVRNPLLGPTGATRTYGPQKGATPEMIEILEQNMTHFSKILTQEFGTLYDAIPGAGAAGGLGAGMMAFCNATIHSGFQLIMSYTNLEELIRQADLVITGEGKIDCQSSSGKTVGSIAMLAQKYSVAVIGLAGIVDKNAESIPGLTAACEIGNGLVSREESLRNAEKLLIESAERIIKDWKN